MVLGEDRFAFFGRARKACYEFSGIERSARNAVHHTQRSGIIPANRRVGETFSAADLEGAGQAEIAIDAELAENALEAGENVTKPEQVSGGGFRERHSPGASTSARADAGRFKYRHRLFRSESPQPGCRGEASKARADDCKGS